MRPSVRAAGAALMLPLLGACAHHVDQAGTLASLHQLRPDTKEVPVDQGLDQAVQSYREFLKEAPDSKLAPEAMRRLADLKIEKEFGIQGDGKLVELPPEQGSPPVKSAAAGAVQAVPMDTARRKPAATLRAPTVTKIDARGATRQRPQAVGSGPAVVSESDLEQRAMSEAGLPPASVAASPALPGGMEADAARAGPLE